MNDGKTFEATYLLYCNDQLEMNDGKTDNASYLPGGIRRFNINLNHSRRSQTNRRHLLQTRSCLRRLRHHLSVGALGSLPGIPLRCMLPVGQRCQVLYNHSPEPIPPHLRYHAKSGSRHRTQ